MLLLCSHLKPDIAKRHTSENQTKDIVVKERIPIPTHLDIKAVSLEEIEDSTAVFHVELGEACGAACGVLSSRLHPLILRPPLRPFTPPLG